MLYRAQTPEILWIEVNSKSLKNLKKKNFLFKKMEIDISYDRIFPCNHAVFLNPAFPYLIC